MTGARALAASFALGTAALAGCTLIADPGQFEIAPAPEEPETDCRTAGASAKCDGLVPLRCSSESGEWEAAGPACAGEAPRCLDGVCVACLPPAGSCIDGVPQACGGDGRWQAQPACPAGQSCVTETGACAACKEGEKRPCPGALGACAEGTQTCEQGAWSECNVSPTEDRCEPVGSDDDCDGVPNAPEGGCGACTGPITCDGLAVGICQPGVSACQAGERGPCVGAVGPAARDCGSPHDNDCNGTPDGQDDSCLCDPAAEPQSCADYPRRGICQPSRRLCSLGPGNSSSSWGPCTGGVAPRAADCGSSLDNDCDGTPDDQSPTCPCREGETQACRLRGCSGVRQCVASVQGSTSWGPCQVPASWDFAPPELVTGLGLKPPIWAPALFNDGLGLLVTNGSPEDIYITRRATRGPSFSAAVPLDAINTPSLEGTPFVAASGLYFDSNRLGTRDLWFAPGSPATWSAPVELSTLNSPRDEQNPWVSADEQLLIFDSDRDGGLGASDLWAVVWADGAWGDPVNLTELNSDASDEGATLTGDALTVFFASSREGSAGANDIWLAERASRDDTFSVPVRVPALSSPGDEIDLALSPDARELFFTSSRDVDYQLYRAERACTTGS